MHPTLNIAIRAARAAGDSIVRQMDRVSDISIESKGQNDFVTEVDKNAEEIIIYTIKKPMKIRVIVFTSHIPGFKLSDMLVISSGSIKILIIIKTKTAKSNKIIFLNIFSISINFYIINSLQIKTLLQIVSK